MSRWRPVLRIARRTVMRSRGRSLLVAILVGLPVASATYADVIVRTLTSPERDAQNLVGSANAALTVTASKRLPGGYDPRALAQGYVTGSGSQRLSRGELAEMLPAGTRLVEAPRQRQLTLARGERRVRTDLTIGDVREPLHRFEMRLQDGARAPGPGEVLVTRRLAERLKLIGDDAELSADAAVTLADGPRLPVSGLVRDPTCLSCDRVMAPAGSKIVRLTAKRGIQDLSINGTSDVTYLVDLPHGVDIDALGRALAARGVALTSRDALAHPERYEDRATGSIFVDAPTLRAAALVAIIVGLGLLEIVLLAGTAFAVGARRQVRELGLVVAAGGGGPRDVRRIVLSQGAVLGALGAALGVATGFAVVEIGRPLWERFNDAEIPGWSFGPWEIAGAAFVGLLSGVAAAIIPALGASRMRPVNALAGRFRVSAGSSRRSALIGSALVAVGAGCGLLGDRILAHDIGLYERSLARGAEVLPPSQSAAVTLIVGGATLAVLGLVLLAPVIIGLIARGAGRLPLSARLAVRDAGRHRHRTGPATGAIVVAVAGSVVLAFLLAGQNRADELGYRALLPPDVISVTPDATSAAAMVKGAERAAAELPRARRLTLSVPLGAPPRRVLQDPDISERDLRGLAVVRSDRPCSRGIEQAQCSDTASGRSGTLAIGADDALTRLIAGPGFDDRARRALVAGKVLVFDAGLLDRARRVRVALADDGEVRLPGHLVADSTAYGLFPSGLVSSRAARAQGWDLRADSVLVRYGAGADRDEVDAALAAAERSGAYPLREEGPDGWQNLGLLLVTAAAALIALIGVAISIALSAAEGRADLATLAAVGAPASRRRALMAGQALLVGGLGCVLGVALGTFVAFTARATTDAPGLVVPWANLGVTLVGIPLLAALVAALCTRGRLPMTARAE